MKGGEKMKKNILKGLLLILTLTLQMSCGKEPVEILAVQIEFDKNIGYISIIETMKNDASIHLDTIIHDFLPTNTNGYKFQLVFKKDDTNGDYLIISNSCDKTALISEVVINEDYTFSYLFNGTEKTKKDLTINVTYDMLCN